MKHFLKKALKGLTLGAALEIFLCSSALAQTQAGEIGAIEGKTYVNQWADLKMSFPEEAAMRLGDGSSTTYPLAAGEHVDAQDPELGYRVTVDFENVGVGLADFLVQLAESAKAAGYQKVDTGTTVLGGHEYRSLKASYPYSDGTSYHADAYAREQDGKIILLKFEYYEELQSRIDLIYGSIGAAE